MDEDRLQGEIRGFLKKFGIRANRELAEMLRSAEADGRLDPSEPVPIRARVTVEGLDSEVVVEGTLALA